MRRTALATLAFLALGVPAFLAPAPAHAEDAAAEEAIKPTKISDFDAIFAEVTTIHDQLRDVKASCAGANKELTSALGLADGTPVADALADLKAKAEGKVEVVLEGTKPKLKATDAVPANVQTALDAANKAVDIWSKAVQDTVSLKDPATQLATRTADLAKSVNKDLLKKNGLGLSELPTVAADTKHNVAVTRSTPDKIEGVTTEIKASLDAVTATFGG